LIRIVIQIKTKSKCKIPPNPPWQEFQIQNSGICIVICITTKI